MLFHVVVITETRYSGMYEGGSWAAFSVSDFTSVPTAAFGADADAVHWWSQPSVPVGVGDTPNEALRHLAFLLARDRDGERTGYFAEGDRVRVARGTPDGWYADGVGVVRAVEFREARPYVGGLRGGCVYTVDFEEQAGLRVPESYLRRAVPILGT
jgi:hypothetical protein